MCVFSLNQVGLPYFLGTVDILELYIVKSKNVKTPSRGEIKTFTQQALLHWVFREEPTRQVCGLWCADVVGAGREEIILVALFYKMVMSCSLERVFILD